MKTTNPRPRPLTRGLVAGGLLVTLAVPALAGTAHAAERNATPAPVPTAEPTTADTEPTTADTEPAEAATPVPTTPGRPTQAPTPVASQAPTTAPDGSADQDELAHTGSSTTTAVMGAGAAVLVAAGGGALYAVRRRRTR
ncbi:LAETG motif-containing sortase-dependent surface protein [Streptomyces sp. S.PNR 29]|uniref:LAETG motif-containing sortase-dependent surface protein n=1 Tax=Streptomyces sp. S.PNR 29 TaxID=2973805 RepID=UPI0025B23988|nr:LAETG motif-containing sortase-dependent surface protein [Streptomyces sp. S.PNR 29]MDN0200744.1 LPXTG cell wall anchor domain-containing protein [Streptomyces sp. S.PNR 29]